MKFKKQSKEAKINFFEKINKIVKLLARMTKKIKRHKLLLSGRQWDITTDPADIKMIMRRYYKK